MALDLKEIGSTGLNRQGGVVQEEFLTELRGDKWVKTIRRMSEQDAICGAVLFAIEMQIRNVDYEVNPASDDPRAVEVAEFVESCLDDMSLAWDDTMTEILTMLPYGWAYLEQVYKYRQGPSNDPKRNSRFNDGRVGWRKWAIRAQDTLDEWVFDDDGGIQGMRQTPPPTYQRKFIPIEKALLFRTAARKGNPEGRSVLRTAYESWYFKRNIQRIEGIGIERDMAGLPVAYVPPEILSSTADANQVALYDMIKDIVVNIRRDEQEGVVWPLAYDENGNKIFDLSLLASSGTRQFDTDVVIRRHEQRMAMSVLADFIMLGHEGVGSYSLSNNKTSLFTYAINSWLKSIAEVINRHAIPRLVRLNGWPEELTPRLEFGEVGEVSLVDIADYVQKLTGSNIILPDDELERHMRQRASLPAPEDGTRREKSAPVTQPPSDNTGQDAPVPDASVEEQAAAMSAALRILSRGE